MFVRIAPVGTIVVALLFGEPRRRRGAADIDVHRTRRSHPLERVVEKELPAGVAGP